MPTIGDTDYDIWADIVAAQIAQGHFNIPVNARPTIYHHFCTDMVSTMEKIIQGAKNASEEAATIANGVLIDTLAVTVYVRSHLGNKLRLWRLMIDKATAAAVSALPKNLHLDTLLTIVETSPKHRHFSLYLSSRTSAVGINAEVVGVFCGVCTVPNEAHAEKICGSFPCLRKE